MSDLIFVMKLRLRPNDEDVKAFKEMSWAYTRACNDISQYAFDNGFILKPNALFKPLYRPIREKFGLKAQMTTSAFRTVTAKYKAVKEQLRQNPYKYKDENDKWVYIQRTLEWLWKPVHFSRPQIDLLRNRDYSFVEHGSRISISTLGKRIKMGFDKPDCYKKYFDGTWTFGTGKLVSLKGKWYLHIPMTKANDKEFDPANVAHVVGLDRGIRFLTTGYDESGKTSFVSGEELRAKRQKFADVRAELQSKGTKSAKRVLKRLSGRENRWMSDVNHRVSKALVQKYGPNTLFVLEDLTGASFAEENQKKDKTQNRELHTWAFYQFEQFLTYKARAAGSEVLKVSAQYTSQRCPKCGRIRKENRNSETHEYICDSCGYRSNDDRIAAMNLRYLGEQYLLGDPEPKFSK